MIIDCHIHAGELGKHYPEWWVKELYTPWGGIHNWHYDKPDMSVGERLVYQLDRVGVDMACIMTSDHRRVYPNDGGPYTPNDYLLEVKSVAPDRFALTCSVDPLRGIEDSVKEIKRCVKDHGFTACKLYPSYDHFDPRDERLDPIYKTLVDHDVTMQIHMGWTPSKNAPMKFQQPYLLDDVAAKYPDLKIVVAHVGWPWVDECMALIAKWDNVHRQGIRRDLRLPQAAVRLGKLTHAHGCRHVPQLRRRRLRQEVWRRTCVRRGHGIDHVEEHRAPLEDRHQQTEGPLIAFSHN
jgi:hypothetical protein